MNWQAFGLVLAVFNVGFVCILLFGDSQYASAGSIASGIAFALVVSLIVGFSSRNA